MDLKDIVAPLPAESHIRRVIEFCITDLALTAQQAAFVLGRAAKVSDGLSILDHEGKLARGEFTQAAFERMDKLCADISNIARPLLKR